MSGPGVRLLVPAPGPCAGGGVGSEVDGARLVALYAHADPGPGGVWLRANAVTSLDGAAAGPEGRSGSLGGEADRAVFDVLRGLADVVLVTAGTARAEGYGLPRPVAATAAAREALGQARAAVLAVVTRSGDVRGREELLDGSTHVLTCTAAGERVLAGLRERAGHDRVHVMGEEGVDVAAALDLLAALGLRRVLCEGGPSLYRAVAAAGRLDELCLTWSPRLIGDAGPSLLAGGAVDVALRLRHLIAAADGTLLGRWTARARGPRAAPAA